MKPSVRLPAGAAVVALLLLTVSALLARHARVLAQTGEPAPALEIVSPTADAYISGATTLRATVTPPGAASRVLFSIDGRQVCETSTAPFECSWEAGGSITAHQVRAVAELVGGGRVIRTVRTRRPWLRGKSRRRRRADHRDGHRRPRTLRHRPAEDGIPCRGRRQAAENLALRRRGRAARAHRGLRRERQHDAGDSVA